MGWPCMVRKVMKSVCHFDEHHPLHPAPVYSILFLKFSACGLSVSFSYCPIWWGHLQWMISYRQKARRISSSVMSVSSTTSCNKAQMTAVGPRPISSKQILATSMGWKIGFTCLSALVFVGFNGHCVRLFRLAGSSSLIFDFMLCMRWSKAFPYLC